MAVAVGGGEGDDGMRHGRVRGLGIRGVADMVGDEGDDGMRCVRMRSLSIRGGRYHMMGGGPAFPLGRSCVAALDVLLLVWGFTGTPHWVSLAGVAMVAAATSCPTNDFYTNM